LCVARGKAWIPAFAGMTEFCRKDGELTTPWSLYQLTPKNTLLARVTVVVRLVV